MTVAITNLLVFLLISVSPTTSSDNVPKAPPTPFAFKFIVGFSQGVAKEFDAFTKSWSNYETHFTEKGANSRDHSRVKKKKKSDQKHLAIEIWNRGANSNTGKRSVPVSLLNIRISVFECVSFLWMKLLIS